jgi:hypothetical protein
MTTTQKPQWHNDPIDIMDGDRILRCDTLGAIADWLEDYYTSWPENRKPITEDLCCEMAYEYWDETEEYWRGMPESKWEILAGPLGV